jgi:hypothetical protein
MPSPPKRSAAAGRSAPTLDPSRSHRRTWCAISRSARRASAGDRHGSNRFITTEMFAPTTTSGATGTPRGPYDKDATGKLTLALSSESRWFAGRQGRWSDRQSWAPEERPRHLPALLQLRPRPPRPTHRRTDPRRPRLRCPQEGAQMSRTCRHLSESVHAKRRGSPRGSRRRQRPPPPLGSTARGGSRRQIAARRRVGGARRRRRRPLINGAAVAPPASPGGRCLCSAVVRETGRLVLSRTWALGFGSVKPSVAAEHVEAVGGGRARRQGH